MLYFDDFCQKSAVDKLKIAVILSVVFGVLARVLVILHFVDLTLGGAFGMKELKRLRLQAGKSQADVAKAIGVWCNVLWRIEAGKKNATDAERSKLAFYFGVSVDDLFDSLGFVLVSKDAAPVVEVTRLRALRVARGLTCRTLCAELGLNPGQFSQVELGRFAASRPQQRKLSEYYGVPITELFGDTGLALLEKINS